MTYERFLQWVTPQGKIAGFLRLSLPDHSFVAAHADELPTTPDEAMIREVHVYGMAARVGDQGQAAQHHGLGRLLVERACDCPGCRLCAHQRDQRDWYARVLSPSWIL